MSPFFRTFASMITPIRPDGQWSENLIIADADYADRVAFNLIVNFERMLMRRIPPADLARWIDCVALDGGLRPTTHHPTPTPHHPSPTTQPPCPCPSVSPTEAPPPPSPTTHVLLLHRPDRTALDNFLPAAFSELSGKAFRDNLGEFTLQPLAVDEEQVSADDLLLDILGTAVRQPQVKRIMVIPNAEEGTLYDDIRETLRRIDDDSKRITVFTMEPRQGGNFRQELLGYSLMSALGINGDELK